MATVSRVSTHVAWKTTPKEPLPTTRSAAYRNTLRTPFCTHAVVTTCPHSCGFPSKWMAS